MVGGKRTEAQLYAEGYKKACTAPEISGATEVWHDYPNCLVQEWVLPDPEEPEGDITAQEALDIIMGRTEI